MVPSSALVQDDSDRYPTFVYFTPALNRRVEACPTSCLAGYSIAYLQVSGGERNVVAVERELEAVLPKNYPPVFSLTSTVADPCGNRDPAGVDRVGRVRSHRGIGRVVHRRQVIGRQLRFGADDLDMLRALGAGPAMTSTDGLIGTVAAIVIGSILAAAVAVGLSPLAPIGLVRRVYPDAGYRVRLDRPRRWRVRVDRRVERARRCDRVPSSAASRRAPCTTNRRPRVASGTRRGRVGDARAGGGRDPPRARTRPWAQHGADPLRVGGDRARGRDRGDDARLREQSGLVGLASRAVRMELELRAPNRERWTDPTPKLELPSTTTTTSRPGRPSVRSRSSTSTRCPSPPSADRPTRP